MNRELQFGERFLPLRPYLCTHWVGTYFQKGVVYTADNTGALLSKNSQAPLPAAYAGSWEEVVEKVSLEDMV